MRILLAVVLLLPLAAQAKDLRDAFEKHFLIGTAVSTSMLENPEQSEKLICQHYNALTAENAMKWQNIHPTQDTFDFSLADKLMAMAKRCEAEVIGHTLVWHQQTPDWVFEDEQGNPLSREALLARLKNHITTVVSRYKGKVKGWDVVNEALNDDGTFRVTKWHTIIGDDYIIKAFEYAHAADPEAELYYNDYNMYNAKKAAAAAEIVKSIKAAGLPITSVGMQGHYSVFYPDLNLVEDSIKRFMALGVKVSITELDVSVLPFPEQAQVGAEVSQSVEFEEKLNPFANGISEQMQDRLTKVYVDLFSIFLKYQDTIDRVTLWGVDDSVSWRNNWPVPGRTDYPLLLNRQKEPKPAYTAVTELVD
ncbi:endo-1,4-beta-xylanase [Glaciecola sp. 1036]|uniref:endo-1,4-beta-xylanase n=1 Tax=Alteromonadaceae TaxID=72275 RepID=UPI003D043E40